jgi:hypothetical protein
MSDTVASSFASLRTSHATWQYNVAATGSAAVVGFAVTECSVGDNGGAAARLHWLVQLSGAPGKAAIWHVDRFI